MKALARLIRHYVTVPLGLSMIKHRIHQSGLPHSPLAVELTRIRLIREPSAYSLLTWLDDWLLSYVRRDDALVGGAAYTDPATDGVSGISDTEAPD